MNDLFLLNELKMELESYKRRLDKSIKEIAQLKEVIHDNDLSDEIGEERPISPEEEICLKGIEQILELVRNKTFDNKDIQNYDTLHKNLRMIRGHSDDTKKKLKKTTKADLLKIVTGSN